MKRKWIALLVSIALLMAVLSPLSGTVAEETDAAAALVCEPVPAAEPVVTAAPTPEPAAPAAEAEPVQQETAPASMEPQQSPAAESSIEPIVEAVEEITTESTAEITTEPTAEITIEPSVEPGAEITAEPSAEPAAEITIAPSVEPTVEVTAEPSVEPAAEVTAEPSVEPGVEITTEPSVEPTAEITVAPSVEPTVEITAAPSVEPTAEVTAEPSVEPTAEITAEPTAEITVEPTPEITLEPTIEPTVEPAALTLQLYANQLSGFVGYDVSASGSFAGGAAPYSVRMVAACGDVVVRDETVTLETAGEIAFSAQAVQYGDAVLLVCVTDAAGASAQAQVVIPVAVLETESRSQWEQDFEGFRPSGDWAEDLVAIARTQLGYGESSRNFIITAGGDRKGYTRYGDWYGAPYEDWCAMFAAFCLRYAGISADDYPADASCQNWKEKLIGWGAYAAAGDYVPQRGDLVFFNRDGSGAVEHIGIVEQVGGSSITTIEGNSASRVQRNEYRLDDASIDGYGNTALLMQAAMPEVTAEPAIEPTVEPSAEPEPVPEPETAIIYGQTNTEGVILRTQPSVESERAALIEAAGTRVIVLSSGEVSSELWYQVQLDQLQGYIRGDLLEIVPQEDVAAEQECACTDETGMRVCAGDCACACHAPAEELLQEIPALKYESWQPGRAEIVLQFAVEGAQGYAWQRGLKNENGEMIWEDLADAGAADLLLAADVQAMKYAYRCAATLQSGEVAVSEAIMLVRADLAEWIAAGDVTEEMLIRAIGAKSLESMVIEGETLVHVRTGKAFAKIDMETGHMIDMETGLVVAIVDLENGMIYPISAEVTAPEASGEA